MTTFGAFFMKHADIANMPQALKEAVLRPPSASPRLRVPRCEDGSKNRPYLNRPRPPLFL